MAEIAAKKQRGKGRPFVKGQSGNPAGKPPGTVSIVTEIKKKLLEYVDPDLKKTYLDLFMTKLFQKATADGDTSIMKDLIDRVDGKALTRIDHSTGGEKLPYTVLSFRDTEEKE